MLTDGQIDNLVGVELDAAVMAHVFGYVLRDGIWYLGEKQFIKEDWTPKFSADWSTAGQIIDLLMLDDWSVELGIADEPWYVILINGKRRIVAYADRGGVGGIQPAICRAALMAVNSK